MARHDAEQKIRRSAAARRSDEERKAAAKLADPDTSSPETAEASEDNDPGT